MKHNEMLKNNSLSVFYAVINGYDTIHKLIEYLNIGHTTIEKICTTLVDKRALNAYTEKRSSRGRPEVKYSLCTNHYCAYIEESEECFSCILIDSNQRAIDRFDKQKFVYSVPLKTVIERINTTLIERDDYNRFCRGIFIDCSDESARLLPPNFIRISKEDLICNALKCDNEISVFEFPDKCVINVYGNLLKTSAKRKGIERVLSLDSIYEIKNPFYDEIFISLQKIAIKEIEKLI